MPTKNANTFEIMTATVASPPGECKVNKHKKKIKEWRKGKRVLASFPDNGSTRILFREHIIFI